MLRENKIYDMGCFLQVFNVGNRRLHSVVLKCTSQVVVYNIEAQSN